VSIISQKHLNFLMMNLRELFLKEAVEEVESIVTRPEELVEVSSGFLLLTLSTYI
jgi:hypothetical protein